MRRYGSLKYGRTQYGLGTNDVYLHDAALFSALFNGFERTIVTTVRFQDAITISEEIRTKSTRSVLLLDNITFADDFENDVLAQAAMLDHVTFATDIRLKYVRVLYESSFAFTAHLDDPVLLNVARMASSIVFDAALAVVLLKNAYQQADIQFSEHIGIRYNWEQVPNLPDNDWTPRPFDDDIWTPKVSLSDTWAPRATSSNTWSPRVDSADIWTPREQNNG